MNQNINEFTYCTYIIQQENTKKAQSISQGVLYIVATPIGNLNDISLRALEILNNADIIACEDTRHSQHILQWLKKNKKIVSYYKFNEKKRLPMLLHSLKEGKSIALISDAGTPGLSDPGELLIQKAISEGIPVDIIPGPCAIIAALVLSGFKITPFMFGGYLPSKAKERNIHLSPFKQFPGTIVFFETPHRIKKCLIAIENVYNNIPVCIARELTKLNQEIIRGTAATILNNIENKTMKGEITILIDNSSIDKNNMHDSTSQLQIADIQAEFN